MRTFTTASLISAALFCVSAEAAMAQTSEPPSWSDQIAQARELPIDDKSRGTKLKALIESAPGNGDKIVAHYFYAEDQFKRGYFGEAVFHYESALNLHDEGPATDMRERDAIVASLIPAYQKTGRKTDLFAMMTANVARKDTLMTDLWVAREDGITHRMSGLFCPNALDGIFRTEALNFSAIGNDVGCNYSAIGDSRNDITVYLTKSQEGMKQAHESSVRAVVGNWGEDAIVYKGKIATFTGPENLPVMDTLFESDAGMLTQALTTVVEGWVMKGRITWSPELGKNFGSNQGEKLFASLANNVPSQLRTCEKFIEEDEKRDIQTADVDDTVNLTALILMATESEFGVSPKRSNPECLVGTVDTEEWFLSAHPNDSMRPYTIDGAGINGNVFVGSTGLLDTTAYSLISIEEEVENPEDGDNNAVSTRKSVIKTYGELPTVEKIRNDFESFWYGNLTAAGAVVNTNGNNEVIINSKFDK